MIWAALVGLALASPAVHAGTYPEREITLIVPFATGGTTDIVATIMSPLLEKELGQKIKIVSRSGQGGVTGTMELLKAQSDGYTLGMATVSTTATNPAINKTLKYDPLVDLTPIINIVATPNVLAVHPLFKAENFKQFVEELQRHPGKYSYGSTGSGGIVHLQMEIFKAVTKTDILHIAFRGASPAIGDVLNGQVTVLLDNLPSSMGHLKSGRLRPLAVAAPKRLVDFPEVPTFKELGLESVNRSAYYGLVGPKDLPKEVVRRLNAAVSEVLKHPDVRKKLHAHGAFILGGSPEDFHRQIADELAYYQREINSLGLKF